MSLVGQVPTHTAQQHEKVKIESIETSATAGAMTGKAASKKQPAFEQLSLADMITFHLAGRSRQRPQPP